MIDYEAIWWRIILYPFISAIIWQIIRAIWLRIELNEPLIPGFFVRPKVSNKTDRNIVHARLGTLHCVAILLVSTTSMIQHWDESWFEWNFQRTVDLDAKHFLSPFLALWISFGYFVSDLFYISDFPAYFWHHVAAICECVALGADPNASMVATCGLFVAETGGLLLAVYLQFKTLFMYAVFILCYAASRFLLLPVFIYYQCVSALEKNRTVELPVAVLSCTMSIILMFINWNFWWTHVKKFRMKWGGQGVVKKEEKENEKKVDEKKKENGTRTHLESHSKAE